MSLHKKLIVVDVEMHTDSVMNAMTALSFLNMHMQTGKSCLCQSQVATLALAWNRSCDQSNRDSRYNQSNFQTSLRFFRLDPFIRGYYRLVFAIATVSILKLFVDAAPAGFAVTPHARTLSEFPASHALSRLVDTTSNDLHSPC